MFGAEVEKEIMKYCKSHAPNEACGFINSSNEFVPIKNISSEPEKAFKMKKGSVPDDAKALVHSHPGGPFCPSEADMQQQIVTDIPWGICCFNERHQETFWFGDNVPMPPLIGRGFRHGVTDCYALIRDFYRAIHDIVLPEFPRNWEWWENNKTLYEDGFESAGFHSVNINEILPGDVFLATIPKSTTPNHGGIYLGDGLILHHCAARQPYAPDRLSVVDPAVRWMSYVTKVLRHEDDTISRAVGQKVWA
ncbi:tail assembly protein [Rhizobium phage vB_RglS_P106B]|uniref:Tail assembly protein n=1 Tax=Rhizobium phage vB_RglS_P106B TaxID=1458697 RepID=W6E9P7_9CAUD|nr:minor tail protein [Rhizobium phage vB_RglS_P106B]AHJ10718.1 tail assembly protein [Rhizobium phage vB_RglS_P106B]